MKTYIVYGVCVLAWVYWMSAHGTVLIDWSAFLNDGDGGGGGSYYYHSGGGYHK